MSERLDELQREMYRLRGEASKIKNMRDMWIYDRERAAKATIEAEAAPIFAERINAAQKALAAATQAYEDTKIAEAQAGVDAKYPIGTKMAKWRRKYRYSYGSDNPWTEQTGDFGIVEVITRESQHPANFADYSRASLGSIVIRKLKKDGTPSAQYVKFHDWYAWFPADKDMKGKK